MAIEGTIQTLLGALVSGRCYPLVNTSTTIVSPYITYQKIHGAELVVVEDNADREAMRFQFDVWGKTYGSSKTVAASLKAAIDANKTFASSLISNFDGYEDLSKEYRVTFDYYIWL